MELDIALQLESFPKIYVPQIAKEFHVEHDKSNTGLNFHNIVVRYTDEPKKVSNLELDVSSFLTSLNKYEKSIRNSNGELQLGIFYNLNESLVFPFRLSAKLVHALSELKLSIDVTGYPCND